MSDQKQMSSENGSQSLDPESEEKIKAQSYRSAGVQSTQEKKVEFVKNYYGLIALGAGLLVGTQTFLYEVIIYTEIDSTTMSLFFANFMAYFIFSFGYHIKQAFNSNTKYGVYWSKEKCSYLESYEVETQPLKNFDGIRLLSMPSSMRKSFKINKFNLFAVLIRFAAAMSASLIRLTVIYTESEANLNFSLISNILSLTPFLVAVLFYFTFKETLNRYYVCGIMLIVFCAILTAVSSYTTNEDGTLSAAIPVTLAIVQCCFAALVCLITRYIVMNSEMTVQQIVSDCYFLEGIVYMIIFFCVGFPYSAKVFFCISALSLLGLTSVMLLNLAIAHGKAAPSLALNDCSILYTMLLEVFILGKTPNTVQAIAFFIGLGGALLISFESRYKRAELSEDVLK